MTSQGYHECLASFQHSGQYLTLPLLSAEIDEESKTYLLVAVPLCLPLSISFPVSVRLSYVLCGCLPLVHFFPPFFCSPSLISVLSNSAASLLVGHREAACCQAQSISLCVPYHMMYSIVTSYSGRLSVKFSLVTLAVCVGARVWECSILYEFMRPLVCMQLLGS